MNTAQRLLDAPLITTDLLRDVLQCSWMEAIGLVAHLIMGGLLYEVAPAEYVLTSTGRAALQRDAARTTP